jgi:hypothetical protein
MGGSRSDLPRGSSPAIPGLPCPSSLLSLSIRAITAIFSPLNALMLKSPPYRRPERMGTIHARVTGPGSYDERTGIDGEKWELLRDNAPSLICA